MVAARQQRRARSRADGGRDVEVREASPFRRHVIEVRRGVAFLPEAADVAITEVVAENDDDVRLLGAEGRGE